MQEVTVSLDLADILREKIDDCAKFNRNVQVSKEVLDSYIHNKRILSQEETEQAEGFLFSRFLELFLDAKEALIIPEDAVHRIAAEYLTNFDDIGITYAYQDFYAYQFVDKLNDIVRRAAKVRELFTKKQPPPSVTKICREAYLSYLYGFHTSSVALLRTIIESMLKERLDIDIGELWKLNDLACDRGIYPKRIWHKVNQIRKEVNSFVHEVSMGKAPSESKNIQLIGIAQEVLKAILE
ncbi:MAG: hypothetical protein JRI46_00150 [Deltaproteobacteria bacterium]|nr:hypothetical protein [Deltaproteobacteria bacterium]